MHKSPEAQKAVVFPNKGKVTEKECALGACGSKETRHGGLITGGLAGRVRTGFVGRKAVGRFGAGP